MADSKITALASISTSTDPAVDPLVIVDVSDTSMAATGTTKKVTLNNLLSSSPTATGAFSVTGLVTAGSASITGAATVGTTLGVTGVSTLASATITGAATVGTTLGVTGNLSAAANSILGTGSKSTDTLLDFSADTGTQRIYLDRGSRNLIFKDVTTNIENYRITGVTGVHTWGVGGSTAMTLDSAGLGLGESPVTGQKLTVNGSASVRNGNKLYIWDTGNSTAHAIYNSGDNLTFTKNNGTTSMLLDALGNLILLSPSTPPTLSTNGQLTVNATSNTNLRFSYRGSDGTTRVANLTLA